MTYDQLLTLDSIVKNGSFKAASEAMHKSQPTLSMAIKKLEEHLGFNLFNRDDYRPKLTDQGLAFYQKAKVALDQFQQLEVFAKELGKGFETQINISIDSICPICKIRNVLTTFFEAQVATSLNLSIEMLEGLYEKVIEGKSDFGIGSYFFEDRHIEAIPFMKAEMIPVISSDFFKNSHGSLEDLKNHPQIIVRSTSKKSSDKTYGVENGMKYWYTTDLSMKQQLIENGLGWGRLPSHLIKNSLESGIISEIKNIPTIKRLDVPLYLLRNKNHILGPNTKKLWSYLIKLSEVQV